MIRRAILAAGLTLSCGMVSVSTTAQTVLSDYESSDQAQKARDAALWRLAFRPGLQVMQQTVAVLRRGSKLPPDQLAAADALITAAVQQSEPEARQGLWQATQILTGQQGNDASALIGALALKATLPVATTDRATLSFVRTYPATASGLSYSIDLVRAGVTASATPQRGDIVRTLAAGSIASSPQRLNVDLRGVPDGFYLLIARLSAGNGVSGDIATSFHVVHGLAARQAQVSKRIAAVSGHEAAKATALYPFELAAALNAGRREVISYDFTAALARSEMIADQLSAGNDPVFRATGLQNRAYRLAATGELIPYQLYVPKAWTAERSWPLVVALHGANLDETNMLGRAGGAMQALADRHGMIVVAPLGYRINSGYGSPRGLQRALSIDDARLKLSETDVLAVTDLVTAEYATDADRTYLTGNSMGGGGSWWLGAQHADRWAAIAPAAFGGVIADDVAKLARVPILGVVGDHDELGMHDRVAAAVGVLRAGGLRPGYLVVTGGTHSTAFDISMPQIFDFFEQHRR